MQLYSSHKCAETSELTFFHGHNVYNTEFFRQTCDSNKSVQIWWKVILSLSNIFVQITFEARKRNTYLYSDAGSFRGTLQWRIC